MRRIVSALLVMCGVAALAAVAVGCGSGGGSEALIYDKQ